PLIHGRMPGWIGVLRSALSCMPKADCRKRLARVDRARGLRSARLPASWRGGCGSWRCLGWRRLGPRGRGCGSLLRARLCREAAFERLIDPALDIRGGEPHHFGDLRNDERFRAVEHALLAEREALRLGEEG